MDEIQDYVKEDVSEPEGADEKARQNKMKLRLRGF